MVLSSPLLSVFAYISLLAFLSSVFIFHSIYLHPPIYLSPRLSSRPGSLQDLLRDKLVEEAQELSEALDSDPDHVAAEAADLIYFALVRCTAAGVCISDVEVRKERCTCDCVPVCVSVRPSVRLSAHVSACLFACPSVRPSVSLSVCLCIRARSHHPSAI